MAKEIFLDAKRSADSEPAAAAAPQEISKKPEIVHLQKFDAVFSPKLEPVLKRQILDALEEKDKENEPIILDMDMPAGVFLKWRRQAKRENVRHMLKLPEAERRRVFHFDKPAVYAFNSVMNEMLLTPEVEKVVAAPEAQELARAAGFSSLSFVAPLAMIVRHALDSKWAIYPLILPPNHIDNSGIILKNLTNALRSMFQAHNIEPNDLKQNQFITGPGSENDPRPLYLIDAEGYVKLRPKANP